MNEAPKAHLTCNSCSTPAATPIGESETYDQAKYRLRCAMGVNCPRPEATQHLCPMRAEQRGVSR